MGGNNNANSNSYASSSASSATYSNTDDGMTYLSDIQNASTVTGLFGIDPLSYTAFCVCCLGLWALYLSIPRGYRFRYCGAYPKRYAWSARTKRRRMRQLLQQPQQQQQNQNMSMSSSSWNQGQSQQQHYSDSTVGTGSVVSTTESSSTMNTNHRELSAQGIGRDGITVTNNNNSHGHAHHQRYGSGGGGGHLNHLQREIPQSLPEEEEVIDFTSPQQTTSIYRNKQYATPMQQQHNQQPSTPFSSSAASALNDEIAISTTMQQLRDTGVKIIAHGSKGKPKTVRLILTENAIEWRTESTRKKNKVGKMHQVPLSQIMYVDVGKQTTALRRVENASIAENVCLSLLTRDGSLDLEASSALERDALVNCFSLVLDEVHAKNWRDVYRVPSSDLPSSFDEFDMGIHIGAERMEV